MRIISFIFILFCVFSAHAQSVEKDTVLPYILDNIVVTSERYSSALKNSDTGTLKLDMEFMHRLPKILGNADPMRYTQMLPGIQTNSEYDAGIHIQGNDNSHNIISIEGVPVYNAAHMLGIFSVFNPSHFQTMSVTKSATAKEGYSRIGGIIDMELSDRIPTRFNGEVNAGLMSSQGTLRIPIGKSAAIFTSLRISYLNLLYSPLLKIDDGRLIYSFGDVNVSYVQKIKQSHSLIIDFYTGVDDASITDPSSKLYFSTNVKWGNMLGAAHWNYKFKNGDMNQSLYFSGYSNRFRIKGDYNIIAPSEIYDFGYRSNATYKNWKFGLSLTNHNITPQFPQFEEEYLESKGEEKKRSVIQGDINVCYSGELACGFNYDIAVKGDIYSDLKGYDYAALNPHARIGYENRRFGNIEFSYSLQHQYLFNCGFTSLGMPVEFWIEATEEREPQYSHNFHLNYKRGLFKGKYDISLELYYKRLYNQIEYKSSPLDILNKQYSLDDAIIKGNGYNYGCNVMINKLTGKLTGWVSYSFGRAMRKFGIYGDKWFPSNHERIHEANIVATYRITDRLDIGGTFTYASGTPFTSVKHLFFINSNMVTEYGEHNANRLKDYIRLDISANYDFIKKGNNTAGVNISLYNVLCRRNEIYYGLRIYSDKFKFQRYTFLTSILPSLSFYYKF